MADTDPWTLKYSPKSIEDMVMDENIREMFSNIIKTGKLSNISIFGNPGIGKSTLAKILVDKLDCEYWFQPCSVDGSIDMVKSTIKDFCDIVPLKKYKVVILDEADQLSLQAQMALRNIIVDSTEKCRFILTANYQDKVIDALKSRCTPIKLSFSSKDILKYCIKILKEEHISFSKKEILNFYETIVLKKYPDIRAVIENLQMMSISGSLNVFKDNKIEINDDIILYIKEHIDEPIEKIRGYLISNEDKFSADYVLLAQKLFDSYGTNPYIMGIIADSLWRMSFQLDKEIQFTGMIIRMKESRNLKNE